jgi:hypothetical protein
MWPSARGGSSAASSSRRHSGAPDR